MTKPEGTGGVVNTRTVKEQILYELDDPTHYLTPDATLDISDVEVEQIGPDRVRVTGAKGRTALETLKVTISADGGWLGEGEISMPDQMPWRAPSWRQNHARTGRPSRP